MKKRFAISVGLGVLGAAAFGVFKGVPLVRNAIELRKYTRQAAFREPQAIAKWKEEFGDPAAVLASFPEKDDDDTAKRLIDLSHQLGIDMARAKRSPRPTDLGTPLPRPAASDQALSKAVGDYDETELQAIRGPIGLPPQLVRDFLTRRRVDIASVVSVLTTLPPPVWKMKSSLGLEAPVPNLLGQLRLQRLLSAGALEEARAGDNEEAARFFRASWNLNVSVRDRPEVVSQLIAMAVARLHAGLARRLAINPLEWQTKLGDHDYRMSLLRAMGCEVAGEFLSLNVGASQFDQATRADLLDSMRRLFERLRASSVSDRMDANISRTFERSRFSAGEIIAALAIPNDVNAFERANRLAIDLELSERVLEAKAAHAQIGRWPREIAGIERCLVLGEHWIYGVDSSERMTIALTRDLHWSGQKGLVLPLKFESD